jgi:histidinol-phosphatase (PHP family)
MCQKAIELGIEEIGFSEHVDFEPKDWGFGYFNYDRYSSEIENAKESFGNKLVIRKGVEIDYQHCFEDDIRDWLQNKKFNFIIGSVHYLDHETIGDQLVRRKDLGRIYDDYFNEVTYSIQSGLFDVVGHFDLVARYVDNRRSELKNFGYQEKIRTVLEEVMENKIHLEINSKGLRDKQRDTIPNRKIVEKFIENGGKLRSIGSDAHSTEEIGSGIKEILLFLTNYDGNKLKLLFE